MKKRVLSLLLALSLAFSFAIPLVSAADGSEESDNYAKQNYGRWAVTVKSYLFDNGSGLTRVEYLGGHVIVEDYDSDFHFLSGRTLEPELPLWGGFYAGEQYNFIITGQENPNQDDSLEVIRVTKYDKSWTRLGAASLKGANTTVPFDAASLRCDERDGYLYIRTGHKMYKSSDGLNHQSNLTMSVNEDTMAVADSFTSVMNISYGYVSHSFNQFLLVDSEGRLVGLDHGDAYPRGAVLTRYPAVSAGKFTGRSVENVTFQTYAGGVGNNTTGANLGGLAETSQGYLAAHVYDGKGGGGVKVPYLSFISRDGLTATTRALPYSGTKSACPPMLVPTGTDSGYVLWCEGNDGANSGTIWYYVNPDGSKTPFTPATTHGDDTLSYVTYNADGTFGAVLTAADTPLSDCQPIVYNGKVTWYVTNNSAPIFYTLGADGVKAHAVTTETEPTATATPEPTVTPTPAPTPAPTPEPTATPAPTEPEQENPFTDVKESDYFYDAVQWAYYAEPQVTTGMTSTEFGPDETVTRGQVVTFLWRAMGCPEPKSTVNPFVDVKTSSYYYRAVLWAVEKGITKGTDDTHFTPNQTCSTAHIITFLYRAMGVGADGWYEAASTWANFSGLLEGLEIKVSPKVDCPRSDVVLFLYRKLAE